MTEERSPRIFDYFAAAVLANSLIYFWTSVVTEVPALWILNIPVYISGGALPSWFVCRRASRNFLLVGLRVGVGAWALTAFMISTMAEGVDLGFVVILFACVMFGALGIAYSRQRDKIRAKAREDADLP